MLGRDGETLVDVAAGALGQWHRARVTPSTLFPLFSVSKAMLATAAHVAAATGKLKRDALVLAHDSYL